MKKWGWEVEKDKTLQEAVLKFQGSHPGQKILRQTNETLGHLPSAKHRLDEYN